MLSPILTSRAEAALASPAQPILISSPQPEHKLVAAVSGLLLLCKTHRPPTVTYSMDHRAVVPRGKSGRFACLTCRLPLRIFTR
jgi:hypothetical protein